MNTPPSLSSRVSSWVLCVLGMILVFWISTASLYFIPEFAEIFKELGLKLPTSTVLLIDAYSYGAIYALILIFIVNFVSEFWFQGRPWKVIVNGTLLLSALLFWWFVTHALFSPLLSIIRRLGAG